MKKSLIKPDTEEFLKKPYAKIPKEIEERIRPRDFVVQRDAKLRYDGKQFVTRIPLKISREMELDKNKSYFLRFITRRQPPPSKEKVKIEITFGENP